MHFEYTQFYYPGDMEFPREYTQTYSIVLFKSKLILRTCTVSRAAQNFWGLNFQTHNWSLAHNMTAYRVLSISWDILPYLQSPKELRWFLEVRRSFFGLCIHGQTAKCTSRDPKPGSHCVPNSWLGLENWYSKNFGRPLSTLHCPQGTVSSIVGLKQNAGSLSTPVTATVFIMLFHMVPTTDQILWNIW